MYVLLLLLTSCMLRQSCLSHPFLFGTWGNLGHSVSSATISMQKALLWFEFHLCTEHFLPLLFLLGRQQDKQSSAGKGSKAPPLNRRWCNVLVVLTSEREIFCCLSTNSHSHPLKQEFPKLFIWYKKRCKEFFCCCRVSTCAKQSSPGWASMEV